MVFTYKDYTLTYDSGPDARFFGTENGTHLYEFTGTLTKSGKLIGNYSGDILTFQKLEKTLRSKNIPAVATPCNKRPPFTFDAIVTSYEKFLSLFPPNSVFMFDYIVNGRKWSKGSQCYDMINKTIRAEIYDLDRHVSERIIKYGYYGFRYKIVVLTDNTSVVYIK